MLGWFDHSFAYVADNDLDGALDRFERSGFLVQEKSMRHPAGMLNAFTSMTGSYLELISIEREREFENEADKAGRFFRRFRRPYGIGFVTSDPEGLYHAIRATRPGLDKPQSRGETGASNDEPIWTFLSLPDQCTPGARLFGVKYHRKPTGKIEVRMGPNTIYGVGGFWLCADEPDDRVAEWTKTFHSTSPQLEFSERSLVLGRQRIDWITPRDYRDTFEVEWQEVDVPCGEIAAVRLFCTDLDAAQTNLTREDFRLVSRHENRLVFAPDPMSGFTFIVERDDPLQFVRFLQSAGHDKRA